MVQSENVVHIVFVYFAMFMAENCMHEMVQVADGLAFFFHVHVDSALLQE